MTFQLSKLSRRIENRERRLARWVATADTDFEFARIERLEAKLEISRQKLDALLNPPTALPKLDVVTGKTEPDQFNIRLEITEIAGSPFGRIHVDIVDSPTDDTFTGGDPLILRSSFVDGKGMDAYGRTWNSRRNTSTSLFANGDYWAGEAEQTLSCGSSSLGYLLENFDSGTVTLYIDPATGSWDERNENKIQIYSQEFAELV